MNLVGVMIQGILLGGFYALLAAGLSLMFGVMRFVNIAHGDFVVAAAYGALTAVSLLGMAPALTFVFVIPFMAAAGYFLQRMIFNRTLRGGLLSPLLVTFGISVIIQNLLLIIFSADGRKLQLGHIETASFPISATVAVGILPLLNMIVAVVVIAGLQLFLYRTALGRVLRATSDDDDTVRLMGANNARVFGYATAIASAVAGLAGIMMATRTIFDPTIGPARLLFAFEAVVIGGLGNLWGTLAGGIILGVAQSIGAAVDPGLQLLAGHVAFLIVLVLKPTGLFPRMES